MLEKLPSEFDSRVKAMEVDERPTEQYCDIGGLDKQIQEIIEAIVLPMVIKKYLLTSYFLNDTELLRLPHYQVRQTQAQSKRLDDNTSGKFKKNFQKIFRLRNF